VNSHVSTDQSSRRPFMHWLNVLLHSVFTCLTGDCIFNLLDVQSTSNKRHINILTVKFMWAASFSSRHFISEFADRIDKSHRSPVN
jgi:hypothetical protein